VLHALLQPTSHEKLNFYMSGITAVIGGSLFWIGAYLSVVEAVNADTKARSAPHRWLLLKSSMFIPCSCLHHLLPTPFPSLKQGGQRCRRLHLPQVRTPYQLLQMGDPDLEAARNGEAGGGGAKQPTQPQQNGNGNGNGSGAAKGYSAANGYSDGYGSGDQLQLKGGGALEVEPTGAEKPRYKWWGWR